MSQSAAVREPFTADAYAVYREAERQQYFNGTWYVVRHSDEPHTTWPDGQQVTRQGHRVAVGARQGMGDFGGFKVTTMRQLPDTEPDYFPEPDPWTKVGARFTITRDGEPVAVVHGEGGVFGWFHSHHGHSMYHALRYEGYAVRNAFGGLDAGFAEYAK